MMLTFASFPFVKIERGIDSRDDKFEWKLHFGEDVELISIPFPTKQSTTKGNSRLVFRISIRDDSIPSRKEWWRRRNGEGKGEETTRAKIIWIEFPAEEGKSVSVGNTVG